MIRVCLAACVFVSLAACGPKVPQGNGYSTRTPWKKTKPITLDNNAGKVKGHLSYADAKRARWYTLDLPEDGDVNLSLSFTPTDSAGDATVALEVLDKNYKVISEDPDAPLKPAAKDPDDAGGDDDASDDSGKSDDESDATQKTRALDSLTPGRYYVHLFVTKRLDQADYELGVAFTPMPTAPKTDFPKDVAWVPPLPVVPVVDDAPPPAEEPKPKHPCKHHCGGGGKKPPPDTGNTGTTPPPATSSVSGDIVVANANSSGGTDITFNRGTTDGLAAGRKGAINGLKKGGFVISSCGDHSCKASVSATATEVKSGSMTVTIP